LYFYTDIRKNLNFLKFTTRQPGGGITGSRGGLKPLIKRFPADHPIADSSTQQPNKIALSNNFLQLKILTKQPKNYPKHSVFSPKQSQNDQILLKNKSILQNQLSLPLQTYFIIKTAPTAYLSPTFNAF